MPRPPGDETQLAPPRGRRVSRLLLVLSFAAGTVVLAVAFLMAFGLARATVEAVRRTPAPTSGSEAVDLKPLRGVRISAPRHALDRTRDVAFRDLGEPGLERLHRTLGGNGGALPLRAFELDTGMSPEERYPGNMTLSFDLKKLGVPEALWRDVRVVQVEKDGTRLDLVTRREDRKVQVDVDRNSLIGMVVIGALASLIPVDMAWKDSKKIPGGPYIPFQLPDCPGFVIHLAGSKLQLGNPKEVERVLGAMNAIRGQLGLPIFRATLKKPPWIAPDGFTLDTNKLPTFADLVRAEKEVRNDPAYTKLEDLWRDPEWLKRNVIPAAVVNVASALSHARHYLKDLRKFRYPTYTIDVFLPSKKMSGFGYEDDLWFGHPFILVNKAMVPLAVPGTPRWTSRDQSCFNGLNLTLVHELFHVVQTRYYWTPSVFGTDTWFFEATAVTLEGEAKKTYLSNPGWHVTGWHGTVRDYSAFRGPLAFAWQTTTEHQQHGYGVSYFLEYLRDVYYRDKPDAFLPRLMEDYSGFRGGALNSLWRVTTGDADSFGKAYRQFCRSHDEDMFLDPLPAKLRPKLTRKNPVYLWKHEKFLELRCPVLEARVVLPPVKPKKGRNLAVVVARDETAGLMEMPGAYELRWWNPLGDAWRSPQRGNHFAVPSDWRTRVRGRLVTQQIAFVDCEEVVSKTVLKGADIVGRIGKDGLPVRFERIEHQVFTGVDSWNRSSGKGVTLFAMFKPAARPRISIDRKTRTLDFRVDPSILAKRKLIEGYLVHFRVFRTTRNLGQVSPSARKQVGPELTVFLERAKHTIDISPLLELSGSESDYNPLLEQGFAINHLRITPREIGDWLDIVHGLGMDLEELEVTYREVADLKRKVWGPRSDAVIGSLPPPEEETFHPSGHWEGTTWLVRVPVTLDLQEAGGSVRGAISVARRPFTFKGKWDAGEKAWVLEVPFGEVYLRRVANHGLWLPAPPTVLRNPDWEAAEKKRREEARKKPGGLLEWIGWRSPPATPPAPREARP